jgi:hypothetical protein
MGCWASTAMQTPDRLVGAGHRTDYSEQIPVAQARKGVDDLAVGSVFKQPSL